MTSAFDERIANNIVACEMDWNVGGLAHLQQRAHDIAEDAILGVDQNLGRAQYFQLLQSLVTPDEAAVRIDGLRLHDELPD